MFFFFMSFIQQCLQMENGSCFPESWAYVIAISYIFSLCRGVCRTQSCRCVAMVGKVSVSAVVFALHFHRWNWKKSSIDGVAGRIFTHFVPFRIHEFPLCNREQSAVRVIGATSAVKMRWTQLSGWMKRKRHEIIGKFQLNVDMKNSWCFLIKT